MTDRDKVVRELLPNAADPMPARPLDTVAELLGRAYDAGRAAERADVVAWLVSEETLPDVPQWAMVAIITRLERGAHQREGQKP